MSGDLRLLNRQRTRPVDLRLLRRALLCLLDELPTTLSPSEGERAGVRGPKPATRARHVPAAANEFDLTIHLVNSRAMSRLNEKHLQHEGPTDVITLDYGPTSGLAGEIFICVDEAVAQARRYRADWPVELARYVIHGILHLSGHDDRRSAARRRMKQAENRWLKKLGRRFDLSKLGRKRTLAA